MSKRERPDQKMSAAQDLSQFESSEDLDKSVDSDSDSDKKEEPKEKTLEEKINEGFTLAEQCKKKSQTIFRFDTQGHILIEVDDIYCSLDIALNETLRDKFQEWIKLASKRVSDAKDQGNKSLVDSERKDSIAACLEFFWSSPLRQDVIPLQQEAELKMQELFRAEKKHFYLLAYEKAIQDINQWVAEKFYAALNVSWQEKSKAINFEILNDTLRTAKIDLPNQCQEILNQIFKDPQEILAKEQDIKPVNYTKLSIINLNEEEKANAKVLFINPLIHPRTSQFASASSQKISQNFSARISKKQLVIDRPETPRIESHVKNAIVTSCFKHNIAIEDSIVTMSKRDHAVREAWKKQKREEYREPVIYHLMLSHYRKHSLNDTSNQRRLIARSMHSIHAANYKKISHRTNQAINCSDFLFIMTVSLEKNANEISLQEAGLRGEMALMTELSLLTILYQNREVFEDPRQKDSIQHCYRQAIDCYRRFLIKQKNNLTNSGNEYYFRQSEEAKEIISYLHQYHQANLTFLSHSNKETESLPEAKKNQKENSKNQKPALYLRSLITKALAKIQAEKLYEKPEFGFMIQVLSCFLNQAAIRGYDRKNNPQDAKLDTAVRSLIGMEELPGAPHFLFEKLNDYLTKPTQSKDALNHINQYINNFKVDIASQSLLTVFEGFVSQPISQGLLSKKINIFVSFVTKDSISEGNKEKYSNIAGYLHEIGICYGLCRLKMAETLLPKVFKDIVAFSKLTNEQIRTLATKGAITVSNYRLEKEALIEGIDKLFKLQDSSTLINDLEKNYFFKKNSDLEPVIARHQIYRKRPCSQSGLIGNDLLKLLQKLQLNKGSIIKIELQDKYAGIIGHVILARKNQDGSFSLSDPNCNFSSWNNLQDEYFLNFLNTSYGLFDKIQLGVLNENNSDFNKAINDFLTSENPVYKSLKPLIYKYDNWSLSHTKLSQVEFAIILYFNGVEKAFSNFLKDALYNGGIENFCEDILQAEKESPECDDWSNLIEKISEQDDREKFQKDAAKIAAQHNKLKALKSFKPDILLALLNETDLPQSIRNNIKKVVLNRLIPRYSLTPSFFGMFNFVPSKEEIAVAVALPENKDWFPLLDKLKLTMSAASQKTRPITLSS